MSILPGVHLKKVILNIFEVIAFREKHFVGGLIFHKHIAIIFMKIHQFIRKL